MSYVYLIGWKELDKWYCGMRCANEKKPTDDLWKEYFTSSKYVKSFVETHGDPDVIEILYECETCEDAERKERDYLIENSAHKNDKYLNRAIVQSTGLVNYWIAGVPKSEEHKRKISEAHLGKEVLKSVIDKIRQTNLERYGAATKPPSDESKAKTSESMLRVYEENPELVEHRRRVTKEKLSDSDYKEKWLSAIHSEESKQKRSKKRKELADDPEFITKLKAGINKSFEGEAGLIRRSKISEVAKRNNKQMRCECGYTTNRLTMSRHVKKCCPSTPPQCVN